VSYLALPLPVAILALSAVALGLGLSGPNVYYRDVRHALPFIVQLGLFTSPVVYPLSALPSSWRGIYAVLNPVAGAVDGLRRIVVHRQWPRAAPTLGALAWAAVLTVLAYWMFKRVERGFADRV
jgi:ABC-type polysaccharide/polyol phosphate export permease